MSGLIKKYLPYALIIFAVFLIVPIFFANKTMENFFGIALYFIFLVTTVACSAIYCSKHGLDFLFALIAPIAFLFTMIIYCGGFSNITNIILLGVYLVAGIFGLFLGDLALETKGTKRNSRKDEKPKKFCLRQSVATNTKESAWQTKQSRSAANASLAQTKERRRSALSRPRIANAITSAQAKTTAQKNNHRRALGTTMILITINILPTLTAGVNWTKRSTIF